MRETEKKPKNADDKLEIIKKVLDNNKNRQKIIQLTSKFDREKLEPERIILRKRYLIHFRKDNIKKKNGCWN